VKHLSPAYFALVMATGIVSIAAWDFELSILATGLFVFNLVAYAVLTCLTALQAIRYPRLFLDDMTDHRLGPGFFTVVAGSCILGTQFPLMMHSLAAAAAFLALGVALWIGLTYTIFAAPAARCGPRVCLIEPRGAAKSGLASMMSASV
jgi:tellurite resistance protein TehA-like permease